MGKHGALNMTTQLKVLLPGSSEKLHISDELAECFDSGDGGVGMMAFLVSPFGTAVWHVEVGRDSNNAFPGRRWPKFVAAHGISDGWFLVLRHEGYGMLTVKAFDGTCLIKEFGQTLIVPGLPAAQPQIESGRARRPQFIMPLYHDWMEKMSIPTEFLKREYISDEELNRRIVTFVTPFRDFWHIVLEKDGSNVFFAGDWSKFLEFQGIAEGEALLIRYQGNMVFTVEVFGFSGCQRNLEKQGTVFQQTENSEETNSYQKTENSEKTNSYQKTENNVETNSSQEIEQSEEANSSQKTEQSVEANSSQKTEQSSEEADSQKEAHISSMRRKRNERPKKLKNSTISPDRRRHVNETQPWLSMRKQLNTSAVDSYLRLPQSFSNKVGLQEKFKITLKSSASKRSWEVHYIVEKGGRCDLSGGWKMFCLDNRLKVGDVCTFNVIKRRLWSVDIERC